MKKNIFLTGAAGFIGFHTVKKLLEGGCTVVRYDNMNGYYDRSLKEARSKMLTTFEGFSFVCADLKNRAEIEEVFKDRQFDFVINLAAQEGVRYSLENPYCYIDSNIVGFMNILGACRHNNAGHLIFASSSSTENTIIWVVKRNKQQYNM